MLIHGSVYTMYFITESWLSDDISSGLIDPMQKYMVIRKDRGPARYVGVAALVSRQYDSVIIDLAAEFNVLEVLCFDVICDGCKIRTFVVYRPPYYNAKAQDYIDLPIQKLGCRRETARRFVSLNILLSHSRSFEMTLLSRACVSPYWYLIETVSVFHTVYEIFSVKEWRNLEAGGSGRSRSLKMVPFNRSYTTFYWSAIVSIVSMLYHFQVI